MTATPIYRRRSSVDRASHAFAAAQLIKTTEPEAVKRSKSALRWVILFLSCFALFGNYYCFDNPTALERPLKDKLNMSNFQYSMLYSIYSLPNTFLPLFGGVFVDSMGVNITFLIFTACLVAGQAVFALGVSSGQYWMCLVGRCIFGFGGESMCVASSALLAAWFKDKEMAFAMAVNLSVARLGSVANDNLSPQLKNEFGLGMSIWAGAMLVGVTLGGVFCMTLIDRHFVKTEEAKGNKVESVTSGETVECSDILRFPRIFVLLTISCVCMYGCVLPFNNIASDFFQFKYGYSENAASVLLGIPFTISAVASPFLGGIVDRLGQRAWLFLFAAACLAGCHAAMAFTHWDPSPWLIIIGSAYSIYGAAVWPGVALIMNEASLGTAYGVITSVQNIGLATLPLLVGYIRDETGGYYWTEILFMILGCFAIFTACVLLVEDGNTGGRLNASSSKRKAAEEKVSSQEPQLNSTGYEPVKSESYSALPGEV